jgi:hypothetical protein
MILRKFWEPLIPILLWAASLLQAGEPIADLDSDGRPDVAILVPKGKGSAVKIYLNKSGRFDKAPDIEIDLPDLVNGWKVRLLRLGKRKVADFLVTSENQAVLLLSQPQTGLCTSLRHALRRS